MILLFFINLINMFLSLILKLIASELIKNLQVLIPYQFSLVRYEINCLEEKFQVHLERLESTGGQRRIKPTGLR